jgi:hypothetical protein
MPNHLKTGEEFEAKEEFGNAGVGGWYMSISE